MIISVNDLRKKYTDYDFSSYSDERLEDRLKAIESSIRAYTRNGFYLYPIKAQFYLENDILIPYKDVFVGFREGDTVEVYNSYTNDGLYTIQSVERDSMVLNEPLNEENTVMKLIKVRYPIDIIEGCVELLNYDLSIRDNAKVGVASESISRHSISFVARDASNTSLNYPNELLTFLKPYIEWNS